MAVATTSRIGKAFIETVKTKDIKLDPTNPNVMKDKQLQSLGEVMEKEGMLQLIVIDQNNIIVDGEHKLKKLLEAGQDETQIIRKYVKNEAHRKRLRQILNNLRGENDPVKFKADLEFLDKAGELAQLAKNLAIPEDAFRKMLEQQMDDEMQRFKDADPTGHYMDSYLHGTIKQISIIMNNDEYINLIPRLQKAMEALGVKNHTELIIKLLTFYENATGNS